MAFVEIQTYYGNLMSQVKELTSLVSDLNKDFRENNFTNVINFMEFQYEKTVSPLLHQMEKMSQFHGENQFALTDNLFSDRDGLKIKEEAMGLMGVILHRLEEYPSDSIPLSDTFKIKFTIRENGNTFNNRSRLDNIGSEGTSTLVKAITNIMLINVLKKRAVKKEQDFIVHCMMDEINKLHPSNLTGILKFANARNIYLVNCSPIVVNGDDYKHCYIVEKNSQSQTMISEKESEDNTYIIPIKSNL